MKRYEVIITPEAESGIVAAFQFIHELLDIHAKSLLRILKTYGLG